MKNYKNPIVIFKALLLIHSFILRTNKNSMIIYSKENSE